jgi:hypothetical protein
MTKASESREAYAATFAALAQKLGFWANSQGSAVHSFTDGGLEVRSTLPDAPYVIVVHRARRMKNKAAVIMESGWLLFVPDPVWVGAPRARIPVGDPDPWGTFKRICKTKESRQRFQKAEGKAKRIFWRFVWDSCRMSKDVGTDKLRLEDFQTERAAAVRRAMEYCWGVTPYRPAPEKEDKA